MIKGTGRQEDTGDTGGRETGGTHVIQGTGRQEDTGYREPGGHR